MTTLNPQIHTPQQVQAFLEQAVFPSIRLPPSGASTSFKRQPFYGSRFQYFPRNKHLSAQAPFCNERLGFWDQTTQEFVSPINNILLTQLRNSMLQKFGAAGSHMWSLLSALLPPTSLSTEPEHIKQQYGAKSIFLSSPPGPLDMALPADVLYSPEFIPQLSPEEITRIKSKYEPYLVLQHESFISQLEQTITESGLTPDDPEYEQFCYTQQVRFFQHHEHEMSQLIIHDYLSRYADNITNFFAKAPYPELISPLPAHIQTLFDPLYTDFHHTNDKYSTSSLARYSSDTITHSLFTYAYIINNLLSLPSQQWIAPDMPSSPPNPSPQTNSPLFASETSPTPSCQPTLGDFIDDDILDLDLFNSPPKQYTIAKKPKSITSATNNKDDGGVKDGVDQEDPTKVFKSAMMSSLNLLSFLEPSKRPLQTADRTKCSAQNGYGLTYNKKFAINEIIYIAVNPKTLETVYSSEQQTPLSVSLSVGEVISIGVTIKEVSAYGYYVKVEPGEVSAKSHFKDIDKKFPRWVCIHPHGPIAAYYEANRQFFWRLSVFFSSLFRHHQSVLSLNFLSNRSTPTPMNPNAHAPLPTSPLHPFMMNAPSSHQPLTIFHAMTSELLQALYHAQTTQYATHPSMVYHFLAQHHLSSLPGNAFKRVGISSNYTKFSKPQLLAMVTDLREYRANQQLIYNLFTSKDTQTISKSKKISFSKDASQTDELDTLLRLDHQLFSVNPVPLYSCGIYSPSTWKLPISTSIILHCPDILIAASIRHAIDTRIQLTLPAWFRQAHINPVFSHICFKEADTLQVTLRSKLHEIIHMRNRQDGLFTAPYLPTAYTSIENNSGPKVLIDTTSSLYGVPTIRVPSTLTISLTTKPQTTKLSAMSILGALMLNSLLPNKISQSQYLQFLFQYPHASSALPYADFSNTTVTSPTALRITSLSPPSQSPFPRPYHNPNIRPITDPADRTTPTRAAQYSSSRSGTHPTSFTSHVFDTMAESSYLLQATNLYSETLRPKIPPPPSKSTRRIVLQDSDMETEDEDQLKTCLREKVQKDIVVIDGDDEPVPAYGSPQIPSEEKSHEMKDDEMTTHNLNLEENHRSLHKAKLAQLSEQDMLDNDLRQRGIASIAAAILSDQTKVRNKLTGIKNLAGYTLPSSLPALLQTFDRHSSLQFDSMDLAKVLHHTNILVQEQDLLQRGCNKQPFEPIYHVVPIHFTYTLPLAHLSATLPLPVYARLFFDAVALHEDLYELNHLAHKAHHLSFVESEIAPGRIVTNSLLPTQSPTISMQQAPKLVQQYFQHLDTLVVARGKGNTDPDRHTRMINTLLSPRGQLILNAEMAHLNHQLISALSPHLLFASDATRSAIPKHLVELHGHTFPRTILYSTTPHTYKALPTPFLPNHKPSDSDTSNKDTPTFPPLDFFKHMYGDALAEADESQYRDWLKKCYNMGVYEEIGDGNCLFRSVSRQLFGHDSFYHIIRLLVVSHLIRHCDAYRWYVDMDYTKFVDKVSHDRQWGDHVELTAMAHMFGIRIRIFDSKQFDTTTPIVITPEPQAISMIEGFGGPYDVTELKKTAKYFFPDRSQQMKDFTDVLEDEPKVLPRMVSPSVDSSKCINLSFHGSNHYNSLYILDGQEEASLVIEPRFTPLLTEEQCLFIVRVACYFSQVLSSLNLHYDARLEAIQKKIAHAFLNDEINIDENRPFVRLSDKDAILDQYCIKKHHHLVRMNSFVDILSQWAEQYASHVSRSFNILAGRGDDTETKIINNISSDGSDGDDLTITHVTTKPPTSPVQHSASSPMNDVPTKTSIRGRKQAQKKQTIAMSDDLDLFDDADNQ